MKGELILCTDTVIQFTTVALEIIMITQILVGYGLLL